MPFIVPFIPVVVAAAAWGAGFIGTAALIGTVLTTGLSFLAQALATKPSSAAPSPGNVGSTPGRITIENKQTIRSPDAARNVIYGTALVPGVYGFIHVWDNNQILQATLMWAGHRCEAVVGIRFAEELLTLDGNGVVTGGSRYDTVAAFEHFEGNPTQNASVRFTTEWPSGLYDSTMRGNGICYSTMQLFWDNVEGDGTTIDKGSKVWNGFSLEDVTAEVRGKLCWDPRSSTSHWTENAALCIADYITDPTYGLGAEIDWDTVTTAANICDELLTIEGETLARYSLNGFFSSSTSPDEILERMLSAMAGKATYDGQRWSIYAGAYATPEVTLTDDDMVAPSKLNALTSAREIPNGIKGKYVDATSTWNATDFPAVKSNTLKILDGGVERIHDIELPFTIYKTTAIRLAQIALKDARQEIVETFTGRLALWKVLAGEFVYRTSERYGWTDKPFQVLSSELTTIQDENGNNVLAVVMLLKETDPSIWDEDITPDMAADPAPDTDFPNVINPLPPGPIVAVERKYISNEGAGVRVLVDLSWSASQDNFVEAYQVRWRRVGDADFVIKPNVSGLMDVILEVTAGTYEVRVHPVNWAGVTGTNYRQAFVEVTGLGDQPATIEGFSVAPMGNVYAFAQWLRSPDLDVTEGGHIEIRFSPMQSGATWSDGRTLAPQLPGSSTSFTLPLMSGTYMIKAVDTSGVWSEYASFVQTQQSVVEFTPTGGFVLTESPDYLGTRTDVFVDADSGFLQIDGSGDFDSVDDVDAIVDWDGDGGVITGTPTAPSGSYAWSQTIDLGSVKRVRLTVDNQSAVFNVFDDFDSRTGDVDDWPAWDGEVFGDEADTWTEIRTTQDNPSGTPTWSAWQRIDTAEFVARGFQLRTFLNSTDDSYNIGIIALSARAELPV